MATPMPTANAPFTDRRPRPFLSASPFNPSLSFAFSPTPTFSLPHKTIVHMCASAGRAGPGPGPGPGSVGPMAADNNDVPMPIVHIDQDSHPYATIVQVSFGDRLGPLVDTMKALKDIGLDVSVGTISTENSVKEIQLFITQLASGRKVEDPDLLERIRLTIINNLLKYHPESSELLALGAVFGIKPPQKKIDVDVATRIHVKGDGPRSSLLYVETPDRAGLLLEMIKIISDINVKVESAEIATVGLVAKDKFHVSYRGAALNSSMSRVLVNCLCYYLRRPQTDEDSY